MSKEPKNPALHDPELEALLERALALRITLREVCEAGGLQEVQLWRWRHTQHATWKRRQEFMRKVEKLIEQKREEYRDV